MNMDYCKRVLDQEYILYMSVLQGYTIHYPDPEHVFLVFPGFEPSKNTQTLVGESVRGGLPTEEMPAPGF